MNDVKQKNVKRQLIIFNVPHLLLNLLSEQDNIFPNPVFENDDKVFHGSELHYLNG